MGGDDRCESVNALKIKTMAAECSFDACGIARVRELGSDEFGLREWIGRGGHADMTYMERRVEMRHNPQLLMPGARSVISVLKAYKSDYDMSVKSRIAQYAFLDDYHETVKAALYELLSAIQREYPAFCARVFVDTAPISDKLWAREAGLGWIGHNTLLINPQYGSMCFVGEIVTTAVADVYDSATADGCGSCHRCVDACPNGAIVLSVDTNRYSVDARRCISYNTVENRQTSLPDWLMTRGYVFGCDVCQKVCPYNIGAPVSVHIDNARRAELETMTSLNETEFNKATLHSAMNRIGYEQWRRNVDKASVSTDDAQGTEH